MFWRMEKRWRRAARVDARVDPFSFQGMWEVINKFEVKVVLTEFTEV